MSLAGRILPFWLNPGHSDIKMFVQDTGREFPFLELTFRIFNCWISNNQVGSKYSTLKEQMGGVGPGIPAVFAGAALLASTFLHLSELTASPEIMV